VTRPICFSPRQRRALCGHVKTRASGSRNRARRATSPTFGQTARALLQRGPPTYVARPRRAHRTSSRTESLRAHRCSPPRRWPAQSLLEGSLITSSPPQVVRPRKTRFRLVVSLCRTGSTPAWVPGEVAAPLHRFLLTQALPGALVFLSPARGLRVDELNPKGLGAPKSRMPTRKRRAHLQRARRSQRRRRPSGAVLAT
jgi:hypothetical protein